MPVDAGQRASLKARGLWERFCTRRDELKAQGLAPKDAKAKALAEAQEGPVGATEQDAAIPGALPNEDAESEEEGDSEDEDEDGPPADARWWVGNMSDGHLSEGPPYKNAIATWKADPEGRGWRYERFELKSLEAELAEANGGVRPAADSELTALIVRLATQNAGGASKV